MTNFKTIDSGLLAFCVIASWVMLLGFNLLEWNNREIGCLTLATIILYNSSLLRTREIETLIYKLAESKERSDREG